MDFNTDNYDEMIIKDNEELNLESDNSDNIHITGDTLFVYSQNDRVKNNRGGYELYDNLRQNEIDFDNQIKL